jgi:hypothetical protein
MPVYNEIVNEMKLFLRSSDTLKIQRSWIFTTKYFDSITVSFLISPSTRERNVTLPRSATFSVSGETYAFTHTNIDLFTLYYDGDEETFFSGVARSIENFQNKNILEINIPEITDMATTWLKSIASVFKQMNKNVTKLINGTFPSDKLGYTAVLQPEINLDSVSGAFWRKPMVSFIPECVVEIKNAVKDMKKFIDRNDYTNLQKRLKQLQHYLMNRFETNGISPDSLLF